MSLIERGDDLRIVREEEGDAAWFLIERLGNLALAGVVLAGVIAILAGVLR